jgi:transcriptional antiterminator NusG
MLLIVCPPAHDSVTLLPSFATAQVAVPVLTIAQLIGNLSRMAFGFKQIDWKSVRLFCITALPLAALGAFGFSVLPKDIVTRCIGAVLIALVLFKMLKKVEFKGGKRKVTSKRVFPGYVIVNMIMSEDSWYVVRHTPGVTGFVGSGSKPIALQPEEVEKIFKQMGLIESKPRIIDIEVGENIRVKSRPFENFEGVVRELLLDRGKIRVNISMFGRETPVELDYEQIDKI